MATQTVSKQLADLLATKNLDVKFTNAQGQNRSPVDADVMSFDWSGPSGQNYGTVVIVIDDTDLLMFFGDNLGRSMDDPQDKTAWLGSEDQQGFVQQIKNFATRNNIGTFTLMDINQLKHHMAGMAAIKEGLFEGYYGNRKVSYMGEATAARLVIKHNRTLGETDKRYRYVESLFIETADGERFKLPFVKLAGGRAMLEHVRQGGRPYDIRGCHIAEMVTEMNVLSRFRRASQSRVFEGSTANLVESANNYYEQIKNNLAVMSSSRGYQQYFESWTPADINSETQLVENIKEMFVQQTLDNRIESALPILAKIQQQGTAMKEVEIFETWANRLVEGTWALPDTPEAQAKLDKLMGQELIVGPDATNAKESLYDVIGDDQLYDILNDLARQDPRANIWDDSDVQARLAELGIQTPQSTEAEPADVAQDTAPPQQGMAEAAKWRQGYRASGHPPGYQHKSGEIGPLGGTYDTTSNYGDEVKVPVNRYRDEPDRLADREKTKLSTSGKPLTAKNAARNLKTAIGQAKGKHGPVGVLPEQGMAEAERQPGRFSGAWQILVNGKKVHSFRGNFDQETADRVGVVKAASRGLYNPGSGDKIKIVPVMLDQKQGMAEGVNDYLWHGSKSEHEILYPQQAKDTGGKEESNKNAVYATPSAKVAIAMGLTTPGSDTGMFPNDPQMVLFSGNIRKGQMVYLHKVPKDLFIKHNSREWYSKPGVEAVKPIEVKTIPVDQWLHLIRQATPQDLELRKKYMKKQGVAEGSADKTVKVVKRRGKPIGEIGIDPEASPGNGSYYVKLYDGSVDLSGFDTAEEALAELKYLVKQSVAEAQLDEINWKKAAATGALALGALGGLGASGSAQARVTPGADGQMSPSAAQQMAQQGFQASAEKSGGQMPNQNLDSAEKVERGDNGIVVHYGGKEYKGMLVPKDSPTPRGAKLIKIQQAQMGERGIGNYSTYLLPNGTAYIYKLASQHANEGVAEGSGFIDQIASAGHKIIANKKTANGSYTVVQNKNDGKYEIHKLIPGSMGANEFEFKSAHKTPQEMETALKALTGVSEGTEFGAYYSEQLAQKVFKANPNLQDENAILKAGYDIAKKELGARADGIFRDEDFFSDFVSAYGYLKKNHLDEGSCNQTMEGEYCPEHGLSECAMEEQQQFGPAATAALQQGKTPSEVHYADTSDKQNLGFQKTLTGSTKSLMKELDDPINYNAAVTGSYYESDELARIKKLALLK